MATEKGKTAAQRKAEEWAAKAAAEKAALAKGIVPGRSVGLDRPKVRPLQESDWLPPKPLDVSTERVADVPRNIAEGRENIYIPPLTPISQPAPTRPPTIGVPWSSPLPSPIPGGGEVYVPPIVPISQPAPPPPEPVPDLPPGPEPVPDLQPVAPVIGEPYSWTAPWMPGSGVDPWRGKSASGRAWEYLYSLGRPWESASTAELGGRRDPYETFQDYIQAMGGVQGAGTDWKKWVDPRTYLGGGTAAGTAPPDIVKKYWQRLLKFHMPVEAAWGIEKLLRPGATGLTPEERLLRYGESAPWLASKPWLRDPSAVWGTQSPWAFTPTDYLPDPTTVTNPDVLAMAYNRLLPWMDPTTRYEGTQWLYGQSPSKFGAYGELGPGGVSQAKTGGGPRPTAGAASRWLPWVSAGRLQAAAEAVRPDVVAGLYPGGGIGAQLPAAQKETIGAPLRWVQQYLTTAAQGSAGMVPGAQGQMPSLEDVTYGEFKNKPLQYWFTPQMQMTARALPTRAIRQHAMEQLKALETQAGASDVLSPYVGLAQSLVNPQLARPLYTGQVGGGRPLYSPTGTFKLGGMFVRNPSFT